ncbi:MAG: GDP-mannose 4,6-dehydratase [Limnochordaceae bacterium]|nr:GDP-mannose 4,6-dehydratase [Limnochordaceae bacterium]
MVTGASGFVGGWLAKALAERGAPVVALVRDETRLLRYWRGVWPDLVSEVRADVTDLAAVERVLAEYAVEVVFHLAAQSQVTVGRSGPVATLETNVRGTWIVLEAARRTPTVKGVVVASSDKAYGDSTDLPYREEAPMAGRYPYDVSKSCADLVARSYFHTFGLPVYVARCANIFGGADLNLGRLVPHVAVSALQGIPPRLRGTGEEKRDWLYVEDACSAYLALGERALDGKLAGEAFNFGSGRPYRVLDVVHAILELAGRPDLRPHVLGHARAEIREQWLDPGKAQKLLGWSARWELRAALEATMGWYRRWLESGRSPAA